MKNETPFTIHGVHHTVRVEWAFPTSPNAKRFKAPDGIWTVLIDDKIILATLDFLEAENEALKVCGPVAISGDQESFQVPITDCPFPSGRWPVTVHYQFQFWTIVERGEMFARYKTLWHDTKLTIGTPSA